MKPRLALPLLLAATACAAAPAPPVVEDDAPRERFAPWEGTRVHYLDAGAGAEALVLVHGWAGSTAAWSRQLPALSGRARTLAVDLPGHGASDPPPAGYSFAAFADALAAVLDDAGVARAVVVGHSNGTPVAAAFCHRHPERALAMVGIDGALLSVFRAEDVEPVLAPFRGERWQEAMSAMIDGMPGPGLSALDRAAIRAMALATRHEAVVGGLDAALAPDAFSPAPLAVPVLLVLARQPAWSAEYEAAVRALAPRLDWRVWTGVGHYLQMERPDELRAALESFLDANGLLRSS